MGWWCNRIKTMVLPSYLGLTLCVIGNIVYFLAALLPSPRRYFLLAARIVSGVGESRQLNMSVFSCLLICLGTVAQLHGYVAVASLPSDRSRALALFTSGQRLVVNHDSIYCPRVVLAPSLVLRVSLCLRLSVRRVGSSTDHCSSTCILHQPSCVQMMSAAQLYRSQFAVDVGSKCDLRSAPSL